MTLGDFFSKSLTFLFFYSDFFQIRFLLASKQASKKKIKNHRSSKKTKTKRNKNPERYAEKKIYVILSIHSQQEKKIIDYGDIWYNGHMDNQSSHKREILIDPESIRFEIFFHLLVVVVVVVKPWTIINEAMKRKKNSQIIIIIIIWIWSKSI